MSLEPSHPASDDERPAFTGRFPLLAAETPSGQGAGDRRPTFSAPASGPAETLAPGPASPASGDGGDADLAQTEDDAAGSAPGTSGSGAAVGRAGGADGGKAESADGGKAESADDGKAESADGGKAEGADGGKAEGADGGADGADSAGGPPATEPTAAFRPIRSATSGVSGFFGATRVIGTNGSTGTTSIADAVGTAATSDAADTAGATGTVDSPGTADRQGATGASRAPDGSAGSAGSAGSGASAGTAGSAGSAGSAGPAESAESGASAGTARSARSGASAGAAVAGLDGPLLGDTVTLRLSWERLQAGFVDDPEEAVSDAAELVEHTVQALIGSLRQRQRALRELAKRGPAGGQGAVGTDPASSDTASSDPADTGRAPGGPDTEHLRRMMLRYRSLFNQLCRP